MQKETFEEIKVRPEKDYQTENYQKPDNQGFVSLSELLEGPSKELPPITKPIQINQSIPQKQDNESDAWYSGYPWDSEIDKINREVFGNENFRQKQREVINATKSKRDVIALIPTGGGKSLTFQLSAVTEGGVSIIIMPLLSLITDQMNQMLEIGIE